MSEESKIFLHVETKTIMKIDLRDDPYFLKTFDELILEYRFVAYIF